MVDEFEAGTTSDASSAYLKNELPGVTALRSHVLIINMGGPRAEPWTTLEFMDSAEDVWFANLVLWVRASKKSRSQE